ncbi:MAG: hypothetical protein OEY38_13915, partial [Gammaproteobacteria bacterium]|nr:hypothetical protein [Gammaproteobacteria bacterium]
VVASPALPRLDMDLRRSNEACRADALDTARGAARELVAVPGDTAARVARVLDVDCALDDLPLTCNCRLAFAAARPDKFWLAILFPIVDYFHQTS